MHKDVIDFIELVRSIFGVYEGYTGGCIKFHFLLKMKFDNCVGYYDQSHCISFIDGRYYDVNGEVENPKGFMLLKDFGKDFIVKGYEGVIDKELIENHW